jgi:hypothetical protein
VEGPSVEQAKRDLVGQRFFYRYQWGTGGSYWTVMQGSVQALVIQQRFTDKNAKTDELHALVTLEGDAQTIRGVLVFHYKLYDQGWKLSSVVPEEQGEGKSFSFEIKNKSGSSSTSQISPDEALAKDTCMDNLRLIDGAIQQYALDNSSTLATSLDQLVRYTRAVPVCKSGGRYVLPPDLSKKTACSVHGSL